MGREVGRGNGGAGLGIREGRRSPVGGLFAFLRALRVLRVRSLPFLCALRACVVRSFSGVIGRRRRPHEPDPRIRRASLRPQRRDLRPRHADACTPCGRASTAHERPDPPRGRAARGRADAGARRHAGRERCPRAGKSAEGGCERGGRGGRGGRGRGEWGMGGGEKAPAFGIRDSAFGKECMRARLGFLSSSASSASSAFDPCLLFVLSVPPWCTVFRHALGAALPHSGQGED